MPIENNKSKTVKFSSFIGENDNLTHQKCHVFLLYLSMGILKKASLLGLCFTLLSGCYSQGNENTIDANIPDKIAAYSTHTIEITIKKGSSSTFSKYELNCPPNVTIKEGISKDGNFSFLNQVAKYVWVESPKTDEFTVTMILQVGNASGQAMFEHRYYYIEGETRKEIADGPMHVEFTSGSPQANATPTVEPIKTPTQTSTPTVASVPQKTTAPVTKTDEPKKTNITITPSGTTNVSSSNTNTLTSTTPTSTSSNTTPKNIELKEYKVQIGSFGAKPSLAKYSDIGKVTVVEENGVWKILAGSFATKEEAVKKLEELKTKGYQGFVVVYINGVKAK